MLVRDLFEAASSVLYHYTSILDAKKILDTGVFELSSVVGNKSEENHAPPGHPYFFSTTRTRLGDYHRFVGSGGVLFVLDGQWFNQRYKAKPIDYWERSWNYPESGRSREAEDRIFSREPTIPIGGVQEIHVLMKEQHEWRSPAARKLLIAGKRAGILTFFYTDEKSWRLLNKQKTVRPDRNAPELKGHEPQRINRPSRDYLAPWLELIHKKNKTELSKDGEKLRYNLLMYGARYDNEDQNLGVDLSNARKPSSGDHSTAIKIIDYMQKKWLQDHTRIKKSHGQQVGCYKSSCQLTGIKSINNPRMRKHLN